MSQAWAKAQQRFLGRRTAVAAAALLTVAYAAVAGLSLGTSAAGMVGILAWAVLWPYDGLSSAAEPKRAQSDTPGSIAQTLSVFQDVLDSVPDPILVLDREQTVLRANAAARGLFADAESRNIAQIRRSPELLEAIGKAHTIGHPQTFDIQDVAPVERHLAGVVTPLSVANGAAGEPAFVIVLRDRTEAEQLSQMRADFVANASHELRTPLASLKGFVETLQTAAKDDPKAREQFLGIMQDQAARMSRLIEDLLSLSRIEMHEHVPPTARVDINSVAADAVAALTPVAAARTVRLNFAQATGHAPVTGDRDELLQVAQNLIQNAIKYGKVDGRVDVSIKAEGDRAVLVVTDDGIGIAPQHLPRLTERFYRVSAKESRERGGTGLGLAIVKHIVNRHRGELRIESVQGQGSTFTVSLPSAP